MGLVTPPSYRLHTSRLRQLAYADEMIRVELADAIDQFIVVARPDDIGILVAHMVVHRDRFRRENRHIDATLFHDAQLIVVDAVTDFVIGDGRRGRRRRLTCFLKLGDLVGAKLSDLGRGGRKVTVAIDNHV